MMICVAGDVPTVPGREMTGELAIAARTAAHPT